MKRCFLSCREKQKVREFCAASFKRCFLMLLFRRHKNYMYHDIELTEKSTNLYGYHVQCLKKVTVLKSKDKEEYEDFCKTQTVPSLPSALQKQSTYTMISDLERSSEATADEQPKSSDLSERISITSTEEDDNFEAPITPTPQSVPSSETKKKKSACLFCNHVERKVGKRRLHLTFPQSEATVKGIKKTAETLKDSTILAKLADHPIVAYHSNCFASYKLSVKRQNEEHPESRYWHKNRQLHRTAFSVLTEIITSEIIEKHRVMYLSDLLSQYKALLLEFGGNDVCADDFQQYHVDNLECKIGNAFGDRLAVEPTVGVHKKKIVYQCDMDTSTLASEIDMLEESQRNRFKDIAYQLRNCITSLEDKKLPDDPTPDDESFGELNVPEELFDFVCDLVQGPDIRSKHSHEDLMKITSVCSDLIYMVLKSKVNPLNYLPLTINAVPHSENVLTIVNQDGESIGCDVAEVMEIETTCTSQKDTENVVPSSVDSINRMRTHDTVDQIVYAAVEKNREQIDQEPNDILPLNLMASQLNEDKNEPQLKRNIQYYEKIPEEIFEDDRC